MGPYEMGRIEALAGELGRVEGVLAVVLFGSYARGEEDEGSDVDLLVLFTDRYALGKGLAELVGITASSGMFVQLIPMTPAELATSPLLLVISREGVILHPGRELDLTSLLARGRSGPHEPPDTPHYGV